MLSWNGIKHQKGFPVSPTTSFMVGRNKVQLFLLLIFGLSLSFSLHLFFLNDPVLDPEQAIWELDGGGVWGGCSGAQQMDPKSTMAYQPSCDCCQNAFLFSKVSRPLLLCFALLGDCSSDFPRNQICCFKEMQLLALVGGLKENFSTLPPQPPSHPTLMWTPLAGSSSHKTLISEADYLLLIIWLGLQRSHWWISFWAIILSTLFGQPSRTDCLFPQMKLHSQTATLSQVPPFPRAENTQSYMGLKLGLLLSKTVSSLTNPSLGTRLHSITAA